MRIIQRFLSIRPNIDHALYVLFSFAFIVSIIYAKFVISVVMFALCILTLIQLLFKDYSWNIEHKHFLWLTLPFIAVLFSGINTADVSGYLHHLRLKVPFLVLPLMWVYKSVFFAKHARPLLLFFVAICTFSACPVLVTYLSDMESFNIAISKGQAIPTPLGHIMYSLIITGSIAVSFEMILQNKESTAIRWVLIASTLFLFIFQHILASRTGVFLSYFSIIFLASWYLVQRKKLAALFPFLFLLVLIFGLASQWIPSLQKKLSYAKWDVKQFLDNKGDGYSDSDRILSYQVGWALFKQNPVLGTGIGDLRTEMTLEYKKKYKLLKKKYPHNQYLFHLSGMGIIGFILFMAGIIGPMIFYREKAIPLYYCFQCIFLLAFLVENTIERQQMIAYYLYFTLLFMSIMVHQKQFTKSLSY